MVIANGRKEELARPDIHRDCASSYLLFRIRLNSLILERKGEVSMSGHSKWAQIKRQKGAADVKRGQLFTKLANVITIAVRQGGGIADPNANFKLRLAVDRARAYNMPKENIERALKRAQSKQMGEMEEVAYEGFGPGGISVMVEAVTDNKQRTASYIKNTFEKNGGRLATPGAVSYQFQQKGLLTVEKNGKSLDDLLLLAAEAGAEDVEEAGSTLTFIYTEPQMVARVREELIARGLKVKEAELTRISTTPVPITDREEARKILSFMEEMESLDDVQKVYSNFDIPDELLDEIKPS